jgi:hypothetical protein
VGQNALQAALGRGAERVDEPAAEHVHGRAQQRGTHRLAAVDDGAQLRVVAVADVRQVEQPADHRGYQEAAREAALPHPAQRRLGVELRQDQRRKAAGHVQEDHGLAGDVEGG